MTLPLWQHGSAARLLPGDAQRFQAALQGTLAEAQVRRQQLLDADHAIIGKQAKNNQSKDGNAGLATGFPASIQASIPPLIESTFRYPMSCKEQAASAERPLFLQ